MSGKKLFESEIDYKRRLLEEASGTSRRLFETQEEWEKRALDVISETSEHLFEGKEHYERRRLEALAPNVTKGIFESEESYLRRLRETVSETSRRFLESEADWKARSIEENPASIAIDLYEESIQRDNASLASDCNSGNTNGCSDVAATVITIILALIIGAIIFVPASILTICVPLIMIGIGLIVQNKTARWILIGWAVLTFLANIGNL